VANRGGNNVAVIDADTLSLLTVPVGIEPCAIAVNARTNLIYVANSGTSNVSILNGNDLSVASLPTGPLPSAVAVNEQSGRAYVANSGNGTVTTIDGSTYTTFAVNVGTGPGAMTIDPALNKIYVANSQQANITVIDGTNHSTSTVSTGQGPSAIAVNPITNEVIVVSANDVIGITQAASRSSFLNTAVMPLNGNMSPASQVAFTLTAATTATPNAPEPQNIYYQLDTTNGAWKQAANGSNTATTLTASLTTGTLKNGLHILYYFATDGSDATVANPLSGTNSLSESNFAASSPSTGNVGAYLFMVNSQCSYSLSPSSANFGPPGGSGSFGITTGTGCSWTAVSDQSWLTVTSGNSGAGSGQVNFNVAENMLSPRTGHITAGGQTFTVEQTSGCQYTLSSSSMSIGPAGGSSGFSLNALPTCTWTAVSNSPWITIVNGGGSGSGNISFTVASNAGPARSGTITVADKTFTVNQGNGCTYVFSTGNTTFGGLGGSGSFNITAGGGCAWNAVSDSPWLILDSGTGTGNGTISFTVRPNHGVARSGNISVGTTKFKVDQLAGHGAAADFDGDGKTDISVFRPSENTWFLSGSQSGFSAVQFGAEGDLIAPADFTGDGVTDIAVFRPSNGSWFVMRSEDSTFYSVSFGTNGDIPAPGDFDGDGVEDFAVYRPSIGTWFILRSTSGFTAVQFGIAEDRPALGDFDGDGKTDISVFRPSTSVWYRMNSSNGSFTAIQFGAAGDRIVLADYTGDGKTDIAVWRPSDGNWYIMKSEDLSYFAVHFGASGDLPVPGDYDGDGKADTAVYRSATGTWFVQRSTAGFNAAAFGISEDKPVPNAYVY